MIPRSLIIAVSLAFASVLQAGVSLDADAFGVSLGGWKGKAAKVAEYELSGANYRTYRPEISPTPDGGLFISIRIDHVRGLLSSDDHAMLEITVDDKGNLISAQSSIAIQGRSVSSDLIRGGTDAGQKVVGVDRAVEIGTNLVADISAKMLREKIVEAGRVSFPAALRHNYNQLYQAIRTGETPSPDAPAPTTPDKKPVDPVQPVPSPKAKPLEIKPY